MASDAVIGKLVLYTSLIIFLYYLFWVAVLPFMLIEEDNWIYSYFPPLQYAFIFPVTFGVCFAGGIMIYTMYHAKRFINFF